MIYIEDSEYRVKFYFEIKRDRVPVRDYIEKLNNKERAKILKYIEFLRINQGYLEEPYSKHIKGKIRELRVDFGRNRHRVFYFTFIKKTIILLHAFIKKSPNTPITEIRKAEENYFEVLKNQKMYE